MPIRGSTHFPFLKNSVPKPPPKDIPKSQISGPMNPKYLGGKSAQGGVVDLAHNPNPPHERPSIPAGLPAGLPAAASRPSANGHDLGHMNVSAGSSESALVPPGVGGEGSGRTSSESKGSFSGTAPWLNKGKDGGPSQSGTAPWLNKGTASEPSVHDHASRPQRDSTPSVPSREFHRVDSFWNGMDSMIDRKLGPGDNHDMKDLLKATDDPLKNYRHPNQPDLGNSEMVRLLHQHPAISGGEPRPTPSIPSEFRNAPRSATPSTSTPSKSEAVRPGPAEASTSKTADKKAHGTSSSSSSKESDPEGLKAMWKEMRMKKAEQRRLGGDAGDVIP